MAFLPGSNPDRDFVFAIRAGRILQAIWIGNRDGGAIINKLEIDRRHGSLPDDVFYLIAMSRWAMVRACLAAMHAPLGKILQRTATKIYESSSQLGPLDDEAECDFIVKLDEALGFSAAETAELLRECKLLAASVREGSAASAQKVGTRPIRPSGQTSETLPCAGSEIPVS